MSHIVVYQGADGSAGYEPCDNLDAAIVAAERMRNVDGVDSPRIFTMQEVEFDFRPYYRVEIPGTDQTDVFDALEAQALTPEAQEEEPVVTSGVLTNELDPWGDSDSAASESVEEPAIVVTEAIVDEAPADVEALEDGDGEFGADHTVEADESAEEPSAIPGSEIFNAAPLEADSPPPPAASDDSEETSDEDAP